MQHFFIGVDGGATKSIVRLEDQQGTLLATATSGPANIRLSVSQAWESINIALTDILTRLALSKTTTDHCFHAGMGLAGCELTAAYETFLHHPHFFTSLTVTSDAYTACLGAHQGADGAIIIIGTGIVGFQLEQGKTAKVGGFGFPYDDEGSGAWLGLEALRLTFEYIDGRTATSALAKAIFAKFDHDMDTLMTFANHANATAFATLAPLVIAHSQAGDSAACQLLQRAAIAIEKVSAALLAKQQTQQPLPCSLIGGIAPFIEPYLSSTLRSRLTPYQLPPDAGAILLARRTFNSRPHHE